MSFSSRIKEQLAGHEAARRHCALAELAAILAVLGKAEKSESGEPVLSLTTENTFAVRKYFTLLEKSLKVSNGAERALLFSAIKQEIPLLHTVDERLLKSSCCRRAALRGYFLSCGFMSDPEKGYHLEMVTAHPETAQQIVKLLAGFSLEGRTVLRKKHTVVYLKEGESIADFLKIIDAGSALLEFENTRVYKDMRGRINRKVNCEAANISKTAAAAARQLADIGRIEEKAGLSSLPPALFQMAQLRLAYPEASLEELGQLADPPLGKSGVNHRLRKLSELADRL